MNKSRIDKYCKLLLPYLLIIVISLPAVSQVTAPTTLPSSIPSSFPSSTGTGQNPGTFPGAPRGNTPAGRQGTTPTNQQGNQPANANQQQGNQQQGKQQQSNQQQGNQQNSKTQTTENGKTDADQGAEGDSQDANDQGQQNGSTTKIISPEEAARQAMRSKIYGYSIFAEKNLNTIPDFQIATPTNYVVGVGDVLNIYLYNFAEATYKDVAVTRDGFISLPRVGNLFVSGRTIEEVRKMLIDKFSKFVPGLMGNDGETGRTKLMVTLAELRTVKVFVTGEVINPGTYQLSSLASAFNALYLAGGPNEIGSFRDVRVVRNGKVISRMDIYDFLTNGKIDGDIRVQDNDNIIVGYYLKRVEISGLVKRPGIFELLPEEKLSDVINYAGGFDDEAYRARLKLHRITSIGRKIFDISENEYQTFELTTGDQINVETVLDRVENIVSISGAVMRPGDYALDNSPSLKKLIENAEGVREDAFVGRINVLRTREDLTIQSIPLNYTDIVNNVVPDLILNRLDVVVVPSKFDMSESAYISVEGEVNNPKIAQNEGKFSYTTNMTLEDALMQAGGLRESAYATEVEVVRRKRNSVAGAANAEISEVFKFNVNRDLSLNSKETHFELLPFDQIIVRKSPNYVEQQTVFLEGEVLVTGPYTIINKSDKISDIIKRAGGLTELAYPEGATLLRRSIVNNTREVTDFDAAEKAEENIGRGAVVGDIPNVKEESIGIKLKNILNNPGSFEDLIVQEGDIIRIPKRLETVQVIGSVLYPTTVKYGKGMAFSDFISQSGGFTTESLRKNSYIKYPNGNVDRTRRFLFFNIYPKVEPGSEIYVPQRAAPALNTQQTLTTATGLLGSLMGLVVTILAFRSIR